MLLKLTDEQVEIVRAALVNQRVGLVSFDTPLSGSLLLAEVIEQIDHHNR